MISLRVRSPWVAIDWGFTMFRLRYLSKCPQRLKIWQSLFVLFCFMPSLVEAKSTNNFGVLCNPNSLRPPGRRRFGQTPNSERCIMPPGVKHIFSQTDAVRVFMWKFRARKYDEDMFVKICFWREGSMFCHCGIWNEVILFWRGWFLGHHAEQAGLPVHPLNENFEPSRWHSRWH